MRLRSCVALEVLCGASLFAALGGATVWGHARLEASLSREAHAAEVRPRPRPVSRPAPTLSPPTELAAPRRTTGLFLGVSDEVLLAPLREARITRVKLNRGGSSVSMRLDFENGARAAFKPRQIHLQSLPRREVAAFRINRLLGLSSVPPAIGRSFAASDVLDNLHEDSLPQRPRLDAEVIVEDGAIVGELSWWIPVLDRARIGGFEIDSTDGAVTWKRYLTVGEPIPHAEWNLVAQISDMVLFDFVINNPDRWSGGNARVSEDGRTLYFMDNTLSFGWDADGHGKVRTYFQRSQRFSRSLVARLRHLRESEVRRALQSDLGPFDELLDDREIAALLSRRDRALEYIDQLISIHGADAVLVFP